MDKDENRIKLLSLNLVKDKTGKIGTFIQKTEMKSIKEIFKNPCRKHYRKHKRRWIKYFEQGSK